MNLIGLFILLILASPSGPSGELSDQLLYYQALSENREGNTQNALNLLQKMSLLPLCVRKDFPGNATGNLSVKACRIVAGKYYTLSTKTPSGSL